MTDLNHVTLIGRLTKDLGNDQREFAYLQSGQARANISIAVNRAKKQADGSWTDEASFFDVTIYGKTAENLKPYFTKGKQIAVDGYLKQDRWQDQQGNNRSRVVIVADNVQLCGSAQNQQGGYQQTAQQSAPQYQPSAPQQQMYQQPMQPQTFGQQQAFTGSDFPEDIPF